MQILRNPDRPIREVLTAEAMSANPFGQRWTGHDLLNWTNRAMSPEED